MDLRQLRTFVTTAERGTVSLASAQLRVAQPALSRQIQDLERELGIKLFDRIRRRLVLTTEGKLLLADCRGALNLASSIRERAQLLQRPDAGVLNIAATPQTIDGVLSGFLARYARERPNVRVTLIEAVGAELMAALRHGDAHFIITTGGTIELERSDRGTDLASIIGIRGGGRPQRETRPIRAHGRAPVAIAPAAFAQQQLRGTAGV